MEQWKSVMKLSPTAVHLLVTDPEGNELVKARLPLDAGHPRALVTFLEGLALWSGAPLAAALVAGVRSTPSLAARVFGSQRWPDETPLVRFDLLPEKRGRRRTLPGVGDFRQLRLWQRSRRLA